MRSPRPVWMAATLLVMACGMRSAFAGGLVTIRSADDKLHLQVPEWGLTRGQDTDDQLRAWWYGKLGASNVTVEARMYPREGFFLDEPEDVAAYSASVYRLAERQGDARFAYVSREPIPGPFGYVPWAVLCRAPLPCIQTPRGELILLGGILREQAYEITVTAYPSLTAEHRATLVDFLRRGVRAECPVRNGQWTDTEALAKWQELVLDPDLRKQMESPVRTEHYIILANSKDAKLLGRRMEDCYKKVVHAFPLPELEGRRLLPVYLFAKPEQYHAVHMRLMASTRGQAEATTGVALREWYATYDTSPHVPMRLHEAARQALRRLYRLEGGGAFLQEGIATYLSTRPAERKTWAKAAVRGKSYVALSDLVARPTLSTPALRLQAATLIELLKDARWKRKQFPTLILRLGLVPPNQVESIEQVLKELYAVDLESLEAKWVEYWK